MKTEIPLNRAQWLVEPGCVVMVTSGSMEKPNVMTFSWQTPANTGTPCLVLLVMHHARYSYELIKQNRELVINVPGEALLEQTHFVGAVTGKDVDKFTESGLTPAPAKEVAPPLIEECAGHLECRVADTFEMETHDVLVCEVVRALADEDLFDGKWIPEKFHTLHYLGGTSYGVMDRGIETQGRG
jgi:flavin reductase (DIM6/NTAB) family NADH-FMN oxidoreductase RutF